MSYLQVFTRISTTGAVYVSPIWRHLETIGQFGDNLETNVAMRAIHTVALPHISVETMRFLTKEGFGLSPIWRHLVRFVSNLETKSLQHLSQEPADLLDGQLFPANPFPFVVLLGSCLHGNVGEFAGEQDARLQPGEGRIARCWAQGSGQIHPVSTPDPQPIR